MSTGQHPQPAPEEQPPEAAPLTDIIRIKGVQPYDGDWPADLSRFTNRELRRIKQVSNIKAAQLRPSLLEGDQDALVALTVVMLDRASKFTVVPDLLWDADSEAIEFITAEEQAEAVEAPNSPPPSEQSSTPPGSSEPPADTTSSGESGSGSSETPEEESLKVIGSPPSGSLHSDQEISES